MARKKNNDAAAADSAVEKAREEVGAEMAAVMPLAHPVETLEGMPPEPEKVIPEDGSDGADTPSGHALREVGPPDLDNPGSEEELLRGLRYRVEKFKKRWLS